MVPDHAQARRARELRKKHHLTDTARLLGVSRATVIRWTVDGAIDRDRATSRRWKKNHPEARARHEANAAGECVECGGDTSRGHERCARCSQDSHRRQGEVTRAAIADLWRAGKTAKEIAEELGTTVGTVGVQLSRMRSAGLDIPYSRERKHAAPR